MRQAYFNDRLELEIVPALSLHKKITDIFFYLVSFNVHQSILQPVCRVWWNSTRSQEKKNEEAGYFLKTFTVCTCRAMEISGQAQYSEVSLGPKQDCH